MQSHNSKLLSLLSDLLQNFETDSARRIQNDGKARLFSEKLPIVLSLDQHTIERERREQEIHKLDCLLATYYLVFTSAAIELTQYSSDDLLQLRLCLPLQRFLELNYFQSKEKEPVIRGNVGRKLEPTLMFALVSFELLDKLIR
jgi:hypothetical protein